MDYDFGVLILVESTRNPLKRLRRVFWVKRDYAKSSRKLSSKVLVGTTSGGDIYLILIEVGNKESYICSMAKYFSRRC